jgi:glycosyltransferase involved in cell wall biosynthesis
MAAVKPKIYFIACTFPPYGRGNAITNACVANYLAEDFDVEVIAMEQERGFLLSYQNDQSLVDSLKPQIQVQRIGAAKWWGLNEILYAIGILPCYFLNWAYSVWRCRQTLVRQPGVLFAVYPVFANLVVACLLQRYYRMPLLVDFRDDFSGVMSRGWRRIYRPFYAALEAWVMRRADAVTATTEALAADLTRRYDLEPSRVGVVYNIVPTLEPAESREGDGVLKIVYAGAISRIQRPEVLLQAYHVLVERHPSLRGRIEVEIYGPESRYFRRKVAKHIVPGVKFGGFLPRRELEEVLQEADIGFMSLGDPVYSYATPTKLFDYIELGLPILASLPSGAAAELVEGHEIGLVAPLGDIDALANCLAELVERPELRARYRENMAAIRPQFRPQNQARKWRDLLLSLSAKENSEYTLVTPHKKECDLV